MPLPVISAADLEKFSLVLNGAPLTITGVQSGTASAANPSGLRLAGGNLFRDYTPWTEQEINDWSQGLGHRDIGENGYLWSELDATEGTKLKLPVANSRQTITSITMPNSTTNTWNGTTFWENKIVEASDGNMYTFFGFNIYQYNNSTDTWAIWDTVTANIFAASWTAERESYIIDMCEFNGYLIIVTTPFFRTTNTKTPSGGDTHVTGSPNGTGDFWIQSYQLINTYIYAAPNVFAIRLSDKARYIVGGETITLPLAYTGNLYMSDIAVGNVEDASGNVVSYTFYRSSGVCATACYAFGGYLFIGGSAGFMYTNGTSGTRHVPTENNLPHVWYFDGQDLDLIRSDTNLEVTTFALQSPFNMSTRDGGKRWVTGFAGIQGQTLGETYVYMTTTEGLYLCDLAVPAMVKVKDYDGENAYNGRGITVHDNDIYIPTYTTLSDGTITGSDVIRFTVAGQIVKVGLDQTEYSPQPGPSSATATPSSTVIATMQLASAPNTLIGALNELGTDADMASGTTVVPPRIVGLKGQGWHTLHARHTETGTAWLSSLGVYYRAQTETIHYNISTAKGVSPTTMLLQRFYYTDRRRSIFTRAAEGWIWLGYFDAGSPLLEKDWHSISVYGDCLDDANNTVEVHYEVFDAIPDCGPYIPVPSLAHNYDYLDDTTDGEYIIPATIDDCGTGRSGRFIGIAIRMATTNTAQTPIIEGIKLKYFVPIDDYFRFTYSVTLPKDCLTNLCGEQLEEYDQADWDEALREAACAIEPVSFRDIDGKWYLVRVESESRRIDKVGYVGAPAYRTYDITWNLVFIQVMNPSICDASWEPQCA